MVKFNKELSKKERKALEEQQVAKEEPVEEEKLEVKVEEETKAEKEAEEAPETKEESKTKELYETERGEAVLKYSKAPKEKGYCELRERTKAVYGIKYAAGKAVDMAKKAKAAILDWSFILPRKGDPERKKKEELL